MPDIFFCGVWVGISIGIASAIISITVGWIIGVLNND